ncbi:MAG TPA: GNAT family N-acetyltransferase [Candidatus Limnocylindria bacterium]|nr:GNAT family N-acetyltransferase [Candidatus Limnocylindria bacterium]
MLPDRRIPSARPRGDGPTNDLRWFLHDGPSALAEIAPEWRLLESSLPEHSIFATPEWGLTWWAHFGGGRALHLISARRGGQLVALATFCTRRRWGIRITEFLGSEERDHASILTAPGEEPVAAGLVRLVLERDDWDLLDLWCVPVGSPTAAALVESLAAQRAHYELIKMTGNPVLDLSTDAWDASASKSRLRRLGAKRRALERRGQLELAFPRDDEDLEAALRELRGLHAQRWRSKGETSPLQLPKYWGWVRGITMSAGRQGRLYFPRLLLDGRLVATGIYFLHRRRLFFWLGAHDAEFARQSPFHLLTLAVIEDVRSAGTVDVLDFGAGEEPYKFHWTQTSLPLLRVLAWRGQRGRAAHFWQGRVRPWAWAHPDVSRPMRRWRRFRGILSGGGPSSADDGGINP